MSKLLLVLFAASSCIFAQTVDFKEGTAEVPGETAGKNDDATLKQGAEDALKSAGMSEDKLQEKGVQDQIQKGIDETQAQTDKFSEPIGRGVTFPVFVVDGDNIIKYVVTLLAADLPENEKLIDKIHEEGHRICDKAATEAVQKKIEKRKADAKKGINPEKTKFKIKDVIAAILAYENAAAKKFHDEFGSNAGATKGGLGTRKGKGKNKDKTDEEILKEMQEEAVKKAEKAGEEALKNLLKDGIK